MKKSPFVASAAVAAVLAAATAYAGAPGGAPKTRAEVQARVAEHFKAVDANSDGFVTQAEADTARDAMRAKFAERRAQRREQQFATLDADKNGALSRSEFLAGPARGEGKAERDRARGPDGAHRGHHRYGRMAMMGAGMGGKWFVRADANKDGKVSLAEASAGALARFDRVDTNRDGTISDPERAAARDAMRAKWQEHRDANKD